MAALETELGGLLAALTTARGGGVEFGSDRDLREGTLRWPEDNTGAVEMGGEGGLKSSGVTGESGGEESGERDIVINATDSVTGTNFLNTFEETVLCAADFKKQTN